MPGLHGMAFPSIQWSRVVLLTVFLFKSFTSSEFSVSGGSTYSENLEQFDPIIRQLNSYFDYNMLRNELAEDARQYNETEISSKKHSSVDGNIPIQRRSNVHTPWHCLSNVAWKDLGSMHYPRFVKEVRCLGNSCMHGFYNCRPLYYPLRVLSIREEPGSIQQDIEAIFLPPSLRQNWTLLVVDISVGCKCGN